MDTRQITSLDALEASELYLLKIKKVYGLQNLLQLNDQTNIIIMVIITVVITTMFVTGPTASMVLSAALVCGLFIDQVRDILNVVMTTLTKAGPQTKQIK